MLHSIAFMCHLKTSNKKVFKKVDNQLDIVLFVNKWKLLKINADKKLIKLENIQ